MKKLKEVARLFLDLKLGVRPIARACNISTSTAHTYVDRLKELNVPYDELASWAMMNWKSFCSPRRRKFRQSPCLILSTSSKELTKKGVTLQLLHEEYKKEHPDGYERSRFFALYHDWLKKPIR